MLRLIDHTVTLIACVGMKVLRGSGDPASQATKLSSRAALGIGTGICDAHKGDKKIEAGINGEGR